jgi:hypothetical protein
MIQLSVSDLKEHFKDRTLYPEGSSLEVSYVKTEKKGLFKVDYQLLVGSDELIVGGWESISKADANKNICEDIVYPLLSRGHFLLHHTVKNAPKDTDRTSDKG